MNLVDLVEMELPELHKAVREILMKPLEYAWTLQGFGMLRLYLGKVGRIHVWSYKYTIPDVSDIHDHSWDFESTVIAGKLVNTRYRLDLNSSLRNTHNEIRIRTGEGGGPEGHPRSVTLIADNVETIRQGETYLQKKDEIHQTIFIEGAVTLIKRDEFQSEKKIARVYYPLDKQWVSAEPRRATDEEVLYITQRALVNGF